MFTIWQLRQKLVGRFIDGHAETDAKQPSDVLCEGTGRHR